MSRAWAVRLHCDDVAAAGRLRLVPGVEVCRQGEHVWLRGPSLDEDLQRRLRQLPGAERFLLLPDGQLQPAGQRVPQGCLPEGPWEPLAAWIEPVLPQAALPGTTAERIELVLAREPGGGRPAEEPAVLRTTAGDWLAYAATAPQVRLERWTFAVSADGRVVVRGRPLPPIAGQRLMDRDGIAVPAGWTWSPPVEAAIVREVLGLAAGDLALFSTEGTWERIAAGEFVRATRSAVRQSCSP